MLTVLDALLAGKENLTVFCPTCRLIREVPWAALPKLRLGDTLAALPRRMRCMKCGGRPDTVEAIKKKFPGGRQQGPI